MSVVEYSKDELAALGLKKKRRVRRVKLPAMPPIVWMLGLAVVLSALTLLVHQPITIQGQPGASSTTIAPNGLVAQTVDMPDGRQITFKAQNHGWPLSYYVFSCNGIDPECKNTSQISVVSVIANVVFWLMPVLLLRIGYVAYTNLSRKERRR